jgi:hypothetical protein
VPHTLTRLTLGLPIQLGKIGGRKDNTTDDSPKVLPPGANRPTIVIVVPGMVGVPIDTETPGPKTDPGPLGVIEITDIVSGIFSPTDIDTPLPTG